ncbi:Breast cancer 2, early onset [Podila humilis]|nr:Breast cancer 2, early onset [Podila humilis]
MTRRNSPETSFPTPERTPRALPRLTPCPVDRHATIVLSILQSSDMESPLGHSSNARESWTTSSPSQTLIPHRNGTRRVQSRLHLRTPSPQGQTLDDIAWSLVPLSMRGTYDQSCLPAEADLVGRHDSLHQSHPCIAVTVSQDMISAESDGNTSMDAETIAGRSKKRLSSIASPNDGRASTKRQVTGKSHSPARNFRNNDDDNPFHVPQSEDGPERNRSNFLRTQFRSQQVGPRTDYRAMSMLRDLRHRPKSCEPASPSGSTLSPPTPSARRAARVLDFGQYDTASESVHSSPLSRRFESSRSGNGTGREKADSDSGPNSPGTTTPTRQFRTARTPSPEVYEATIPLEYLRKLDESSPTSLRLYDTHSKEDHILDDFLPDDEWQDAAEWGDSKVISKKTQGTISTPRSILQRGKQLLRDMLTSPNGSSLDYVQHDIRNGSESTSPMLHRLAVAPSRVHLTPTKVNVRTPNAPNTPNTPKTPKTPGRSSFNGDLHEWITDFETPPRKNIPKTAPLDGLEASKDILVPMPIPAAPRTDMTMVADRREGSSSQESFKSAVSSIKSQGDMATTHRTANIQEATPKAIIASCAQIDHHSENEASEAEPDAQDEQLSPILPSPNLPVTKMNEENYHLSQDSLHGFRSSDFLMDSFEKSEEYIHNRPSQHGIKSQRSRTASQRSRGGSQKSRVGSQRTKLSQRTLGEFSNISQELDGLQIGPWTLSSNDSIHPGGASGVAHLNQEPVDEHEMANPVEDDFADLDHEHFNLYLTQSPVKLRRSSVQESLYARNQKITFVDQALDTAIELQPANVSNDPMITCAKPFQDNGNNETSAGSSPNHADAQPLPGFGTIKVSNIIRSHQPISSEFESVDIYATSVSGVAALDIPRGKSGNSPPPVFQGFGRVSTNNTFKPLAPVSGEVQARWTKLFDDDDQPINPPVMTNPASQPGPLYPKLQGFSTGNMKSIVPLSKDKLDRWSHFFDDNDGDMTESGNRPRPSAAPASAIFKPPQPVLGGFAVASGKPLPKVSEDTLKKWSSMLGDDDSAIASSEVAVTVGPPPETQPGVFVGFSSVRDKGKSFVPISVSKSAQDHARQVLGYDEPSLQPTHMITSNGPVSGKVCLNFNARLSGPIFASASKSASINTSAQPNSFVGVGSSCSNIQMTHPVLSDHMNNLKNKSVLSTSSKLPAGLPGALKPLSRSTNQFKSPLRTTVHSTAHSSSSKNGNVVLRHSNLNNSITTITTSDKANDSRPQSALGGFIGRKIGKRALHPHARATSVAPASEVPTVKVNHVAFRTLFNLEAPAHRESILQYGHPQMLSQDELAGYGLPPDVINMSLSSAKSFRMQDGRWGLKEAFSDLLNRGASVELLTEPWVENHFGLIVWKLASYCRSWPRACKLERFLTPLVVVDQLCYRYEREINKVERPALRKIVEGDESASRHMVLCIASIDIEGNPPAVTVTDGWYVIPAVLDGVLNKAVKNGRISVGSKVHVCQAFLHGAEGGGVAILERPNAVSIALSGNNTRLARWDAKLGFQKTPIQWTTKIRNIMPDGGVVPGLEVVVLRKYPIVYLETLENDTKIRRSGREEARAQENHRALMEKRYLDIVQQVEKDLMPRLGTEDQDMEQNRAEIEQELSARTAEMVGAMRRNVLPMFTIRVGNCQNDDSQRQEALITFWKTENLGLQEGHRVRLTSLKATKPSREPGFEDMIQLSSTRNTMSLPVNTLEPDALLLTPYRPREITQCAEIPQLQVGAEIDLVVVVLALSETIVSSFKKYLVATDASKRLILIEYHMSPTLPLTDSTAAVPTAPAAAAMPPPFWIKCLSKVLLANARYKVHDLKLDVPVVSCPLNYTQAVLASGSPSVTRGWPSYAQRSLQRLHELTDELQQQQQGGRTPFSTHDEDETSLAELMGRANAILSGMQPSF